MFRVAFIGQYGQTKAGNFDTIDECYEFLLKHNYKRYRIFDKNIGKTIETEKGKL